MVTLKVLSLNPQTTFQTRYKDAFTHMREFPWKESIPSFYANSILCSPTMSHDITYVMHQLFMCTPYRIDAQLFFAPIRSTLQRFSRDTAQPSQPWATNQPRDFADRHQEFPAYTSSTLRSVPVISLEILRTDINEVCRVHPLRYAPFLLSSSFHSVPVIHSVSLRSWYRPIKF